MTKTLISIFLLVCITAPGFAQYTLDSVNIKAYNFGLQIQNMRKTKVDSLAQTVDDWLQTIGESHFQNTQPGGFSSLLVNGLGSRHLPIVWHGMNIQSPLNGTFDLNLIPITILRGSSFIPGPKLNISTQGLAGAVELRSPSFEKDFVSINLSSLQNYQVSGQISRKFKSIKWDHAISAGFNRNIFNYDLGNVLLRRQPTDFHNYNIITTVTFDLDKKSGIGINIWHQYASRLIPPSISAALIKQVQIDHNLRTSINYWWMNNSSKMELNFNYHHEYLVFRSPGIDSKSNADLIQSEAKWTSPKYGSFVGVRFKLEFANPNFFSAPKKRSIGQLIIGKSWKLNRENNLDLSIRQDINNNRLMPTSILASLNIRKTIITISNNYTMPSLNDLYWPISGNASLKPEKAFQSDLYNTFGLGQVKITPSCFIYYIKDWIQWTPWQQGLWRPQNIAVVLSKGVGLKAEFIKDISRKTYNLIIDYHLTNTYPLKHQDKNLEKLQLIYIPKHKSSATFNFRWKNHLVQYKETFTSQRFDAPDHSQSLKPVWVSDMSYTYSTVKWAAILKFNNMSNFDYSWVRYYPQPRLNTSFSWIYQFNSNKKTNKL